MLIFNILKMNYEIIDGVFAIKYITSEKYLAYYNEKSANDH